MNVERMRKVADEIAAHKAQYDQGHWVHSDPDDDRSCGTPACIAGWAVALKRAEKNGGRVDEQVLYADETSVYEEARDYLGLEHADAQVLFFHNPYEGYSNDDLPTPDEAVEVLLHMAGTGDAPDWERARDAS